MANVPLESIKTKDPFGPTLAYTRGVRLDTGVEPDKSSQDPLLLLRPAVRHPAQGQGQRSDRL
jgi:hypothetical protein